MHIAHFIQRYPPALGGSEAYFSRLGDYLAARGDEVTVWTTDAIQLEEFWRRPANPEQRMGSTLEASFQASGRAPQVVRRYPLLRFPGRRYLLKALSLLPVPQWQCLTLPCNPIAPQMWRDADRYDGPLDAVHATAFPYAFPILCGLRLARRRKVPFLLTPFLHLGDPRTRRQYTSRPLRWLLRQADRIFVQTRLERDAVLGLGVPEDQVVLQGLGVDPSECTGGDREGARSRWGVGAGEVVIGHLANNSVEKGTVDLLRAAERGWAAGAEFRVVLAGPEMPNFRDFWQRYPAKHRVIRLGVLTESERRGFFAGIDAFALPSRSDSFGLVLLEAWANGKPNLVYRAGGPGELVRDGIDGLHAVRGDIEQLAAQLTRLAREDHLRSHLGSSGRARIEQEFQWQDKLELVRRTIAQYRAEPERKCDSGKPRKPWPTQTFHTATGTPSSR